jgi:hypothetical protein
MRTDLVAPVAGDPDFEKVRASPRFRALVARYSA